MNVRIGVIGGSGLYRMQGVADIEEVRVETPFGEPSDAYMVGTLAGRQVAFLPRHGRGHRLMPSEINFRANILGFKQLGVERILSAGAVGSLREDLKPLDIVVPDQYIDRTRGRASTFFGGGIVAHVTFADPFCSQMRELLISGGRATSATVHAGGTYVCMEGPAFSTRAESHLYRSWNAAVIGMTTLQEAKLSREAEICYATMALVTDYDCWRTSTDDVSVEEILANLSANSESAEAIISASVAEMPDRRECGCSRALDTAILTDRDSIPRDVRTRLSTLLDRPLGAMKKE